MVLDTQVISSSDPTPHSTHEAMEHAIAEVERSQPGNLTVGFGIEHQIDVRGGGLS
jgi:hypothetical protein